MNPEQLQEFENMKRELDELNKWKESKTRNQVSDPLDVVSRSVLARDSLVYKGVKTAGAVSVGGTITMELNGQEIKILYQ